MTLPPKVNTKSLCLVSQRVSDRTPASDQVIYHDDHGYDQQAMNQIATEVADESQ